MMFEMKKTQILIEFLDGTKKVRLGFRAFRTVVLLSTTPYVMFVSKKTQILIEFLDGTKKVQQAGKKSSARV